MIKVNFQFCTFNDNTPVLDFDQTCNKNVDIKKVLETGKFNLLEKSKYLVDYFGYSCSRSKVTIKTTTKFFWK